ncbi:MAG TPA: hypothetical protein VMU99_06820 [Acidimicrobiales bacterium]|nr:hypothetical protein [Acidimicrobiales bacterium]
MTEQSAKYLFGADEQARADAVEDLCNEHTKQLIQALGLKPGAHRLEVREVVVRSRPGCAR